MPWRTAGRPGPPATCWTWTTRGWPVGRRARPPGRTWPTPRRVVTRCTACWSGNATRSRSCSRRGVRSTGRIASSRTAAHGSAWCTYPRPRSSACCSPNSLCCLACRRGSRFRASRGRTGWSGNRTGSGATTSLISRGPGPRRSRSSTSSPRKWITTVCSREESSTQVEITFTRALEAEDLWHAADLAATDNLAKALVGGDAEVVDRTIADGDRPLLLAISDNGRSSSS